GESGYGLILGPDSVEPDGVIDRTTYDPSVDPGSEGVVEDLWSSILSARTVFGDGPPVRAELDCFSLAHGSALVARLLGLNVEVWQLLYRVPQISGRPLWRLGDPSPAKVESLGIHAV